MGRGYEQGIRRNWQQFLLQVLTVFAVGLTMGAERNVVPIMAEETFGIESVLVIGSFVVSFGVVKAVLNLHPNLISVVSDAAHPLWRSSSLGVYRLWRDLGYAVGAVLIGLTVDLLFIEAAFYGTALVMFLSGGLVCLVMDETHPEFGTHDTLTAPPSND